MKESRVAVGIDIGNTKVVTCVAKFDNGTTDIIGVGKSFNQGIRKGVIVDLEETVSAISASLEEAERMAGFAIEEATVGISGTSIESEQSHGVIAIARQDGEISYEDTARVIEAARAIPSKPNREVLHVLPLYFIVDGTETIKDPVGMTGIRLEVNANIVSASSNAVKSIARAAEQAGVSISSLVFSPLATAKVLLSKRQIDIGVMLIDIGASSTSYAVFEDGELVTCGVVPVGSMHITNDIAIGLRTNLDIADIIKIKYGYALSDRVGEKEEIDLSKLDKNETEKANLKYISEIIEARLNEIMLIVRDNLVRANCNIALPAGVILTGGGAKLDGLVEMVKETMRLPVQIGKPLLEFTGLIDKLDDPIYSTSMGLMLWNKERPAGHNPIDFSIPGVSDFMGKVKSTFKHFLP